MRRVAGFLGVLLLLGGCVFVQAPSGSGPDRLGGRVALAEPGGSDPGGIVPAVAGPGEMVWPARWGDGTGGQGKGTVVRVDGPLSAWEGRRHGPWHRRLPRGDDERIVRALAAGRADARGYTYRMEGHGAYVFERDETIPVPDAGAELKRSEPAFMFVFASGEVSAGDGDEIRVDVGRTWFAYYDHRRGGSPGEGDPGNGLIVLLPGLFGVPEDVNDIMVSSMRQHGWSVLRMLAPPARFVETADIVADPGDETGASARGIAGLLMSRVAETAYAAEAGLAHVQGERASLRGLPVVVVGGSAGAMSLPAVVKRDPGAYDAAVLIAGGENILEIVARSSYTKPVGAMDFAWAGYGDGRSPDVETIRGFAAAYLEHAPLDGAHAASSLAGKPVLMLHASMDDAVPSDTGDRLWARLGEPERWVTPGNHLALFMSLWFHTPRMMAWLEEHVLKAEP